ncbi:MAG: cbb3-type cytochrome oxidase assembly protein, partial [Gammaproteobacteria bacterium]|nr:cbb3-type cytochrome oxidase assembly protein [Gammaproteobacteria bacterium]
LKNGQFDDMDSPASKILFDDDDDLIPDDAKPKSKS